MRLEQIAREIGAELNGDPDCEVLRVATLENAGAGCLAFLSGERHRKYLKNTRASAVILRKENLAECPVPALICNDPYLAYARVATLLTGQIAEAHSGVHSSALIHASAKVAGSASIGAYCVIDADTEIDEFVMLDAHCVVGKGSRIGARSHLSARVTIGDRVRIGSRTRIHSGVVIGADGFGFANDNGVWVKIPQAGGVVIGDDVEIGANTTIDRGALENTIIGDGVKIDNLVQIAHNVVIGEHTAIAGCVGIAGSTKIGRHCAIGGASGIGGHLNITDGVVIAGMTRLNKSILKPGQYVSGTPVDTVDKWRKNSARFRQLDDLARRLQALEKR